MAAVFFDIDGTIWDRNSVIPESTRLAIRKLHENGHLAFLCSGRARSAIIGDQLFALSMDGIVAGCGTYCEYRGKELFNDRLSPDLLHATVALLQRYHLPLLIEDSEELFMEEGIRADWYGQYLIQTLPDRILPLEGTQDRWRGNKLTVLTAGRESAGAIQRLRENYEILQHGDIVMELVPKGVSKASGIQRVCALLHVPHEETYALGDSVNDCEMLRYAACGIAMGNGSQQAREAADYVTDDIHKDGLAHALQHFGLI